MNSKEIRSVVDMIRDATWTELIIVSLFLLPIPLGAWSIVMNSIDAFDEYSFGKFICLSSLFFAYIVGVILIKRIDTKEEKLKRARYHIETRLKKREGRRASFVAVRNEVNKSYSDSFIEELIEKNPEIFSKCTIAKGKKTGITLPKESQPA